MRHVLSTRPALLSVSLPAARNVRADAGARSNQALSRRAWQAATLGLSLCALLGLNARAARAEETAKPAEAAPAKSEAKTEAKQDAPKTQDPQTNPPKANDPPTKPSEGQPAQTPAAPAAPAATPPGTVTLSGLVDLYFGINSRAPRGATGSPFAPAIAGIVTPSGERIKVDNVGRSFDINDRELSFSLGELNINRTEGRGFPLGVTATFTVGDTARIVHGNEPGGTSSWQTLQQLYVTKTPHFLNRDVTIDFGKFVTPFGYEVIESTGNDNYSRSLGFQFAIPFYHMGLRAAIPITPRLQFLAGLVNGWNNAADDNDGKSGFGQFTWKPNSQFTGIFGIMGGSEGTGAYGVGFAPKNQADITTFIYEAEPIYQINSNFKIAGDFVYGSGSGHTIVATGAGTTAQGHVSGDWLSMAAYARYQATPRFAIAGRIEQFEDMPGAGGTGIRLGLGYTRLRSGTLTLEYTFLRSHLVTRLEYRHDAANSAFFGAGGGGAVRDQDTIYGSAAYKF